MILMEVAVEREEGPLPPKKSGDEGGGQGWVDSRWWDLGGEAEI